MSLLNLFTYKNVNVTDSAPTTLDVLSGDLLYPFLSLYSLNQCNPFVVSMTATTTLGATISITPAGKVLYDPSTSNKIQGLSAGETLTDSFVYEERNFLGIITWQTEIVTVAGVNRLPAFNVPASSLVVSELAATTGSSAADAAGVAVGFTDVNLDDTHTISASLKSVAWSYGGSVSPAVQAALAGALTTVISSDSKGSGAGTAIEVFSAPDKTFDFLAAGQTLTATYAVSLSDNHGGTTTQTVTVAINGADDAPAALASVIAINAGQAVKGSVAATDPDAGDALGYARLTGPGHGTFTFNADGTYSYQVAAGYSGLDSFSYTATDKAGLKSTATVQIKVAGAAGQVAYLPNPPSGAADQRVSTQLVVDTNQSAGLKSGGSVVVWSASQTPDPNANFDIYMQRYDAAGNPVGGNVQITTATDNQVHPSVAGLSAGNYAVVWESDNPGTGRVIYGQVFNASGGAVSGQFLVDAPVAGDRTFPSVTALANGGFAVAWQGFDEVNRANGNDVFTRTYDDSGNATSAVAAVNQTLLGDQQTFGDLVRTDAALTNGTYVTTWTDFSGSGGNGFDVYARIMNANGTGLGNQFVVSSVTAGDQTNAAVGGLSGGGFVVAWQDATLGIEGQIFTASGAKVGTQFQVSSFDNGGQLYPQVSTLSDGSFVVAWQSFGDGGTGGVQVAGQRYTANGAVIGGEFIINSSTTGSHELPSLALRSDGALIATWRDENVPNAITQKIITNFSAPIGPQTLLGAAGPNVLYGNTGNDTIVGGASGDVLAGLGGADLLTGGGGTDHFLYTALADSTLAAMDRITDFATGQDKLDFVNALGLTAISTTDVTSASTLAAHTVGWHFDGANTTVYANVGPGAETIGSGSDIMAIYLANGKIVAGDINLHA